MSKQEFSIPALASRLTSETQAYLLLEELRWDGAPDACPHCGGIGRCYYLSPKNGVARATRTGAGSQRRVWKCGHCRKQFSVLVGTIFHGSKIPLVTWLLVIFEMCSSKNGVSAREIERKYDLTAKTAWFLLHRIREAMVRDPLAGLLRGTVVADETWVGGKDSNRHADKRTNTGQTDKQPVMALVDFETREVQAVAVNDVTAPTLGRVLRQRVQVDRSQLWTDGSPSYVKIGKEFNSHHVVDHSAGEYKRHGAGTNLAEGFFSQLKRSIDGTHHHVSRVHLDRYVTQFAWLYTHCKETDSTRMRLLLSNVDGRRLSYKPLITRA